MSIRVVLSGILGGIIAVGGALVMPSGWVSSDLVWLAIGGLCAGYCGRKYGWISGLLVGIFSIDVTLYILIAIGFGAKMSASQIYGAISEGWRSILLPLPVAMVAGGLGAKLNVRMNSRRPAPEKEEGKASDE